MALCQEAADDAQLVIGVALVKGACQLRAPPEVKSLQALARVDERADAVVAHAAAPRDVEGAQRVGAARVQRVQRRVRECGDLVERERGEAAAAVRQADDGGVRELHTRLEAETLEGGEALGDLQTNERAGAVSGGMRGGRGRRQGCR